MQLRSHGNPSGSPRASRFSDGAEVACVSRRRDAGWESRAVWVERQSPFAQSFRDLALHVREQMSRDGASSVLVTSALPGEGKTLTACNLALALRSIAPAEHVALVDFDLRLPDVGRVLGLEARVGIEEVLGGVADLEAVALVTDAGLDVYPVVVPYRAAHELLVRPTLGDALKKLEERYRWVICDAPPLFPVPDVHLLAQHMGTCLAVVRAGRTSHTVLRELVERLPTNKLLGFFLNDARPPAHVRELYRSAYCGSDEPRFERAEES